MTRRLAEGIEGSEADPIDADAERERAGGEPAPRRILLSIAYDGTDACGWQIQPDVRTIQGDLERAVAKVCGEPSHVDGTSRTDAGVHALGQSAAITTYRPTPAERIPRALNGVLPADIRVLAAREVPLEFSPRAENIGKVYRYTFLLAREEHPFLSRWAWRVAPDVDLDRMKTAVAALVGEHDFRAFQSASKSPAPSTVKTIFGVEWGREGPLLHLQIAGSGFLYNMVRIIAGSAIEVGRERLRPEALRDALETGDRRLLGPTAPPRGLTLVGVCYDEAELERALRTPSLIAQWFDLVGVGGGSGHGVPRSPRDGRPDPTSGDPLGCNGS